jgi:hypothetical protein
LARTARQSCGVLDELVAALTAAGAGNDAELVDAAKAVLRLTGHVDQQGKYVLDVHDNQDTQIVDGNTMTLNSNGLRRDSDGYHRLGTYSSAWSEASAAKNVLSEPDTSAGAWASALTAGAAYSGLTARVVGGGASDGSGDRHHVVFHCRLSPCRVASFWLFVGGTRC